MSLGILFINTSCVLDAYCNTKVERLFPCHQYPVFFPLPFLSPGITQTSVRPSLPVTRRWTQLWQNSPTYVVEFEIKYGFAADVDVFSLIPPPDVSDSSPTFTPRIMLQRSTAWWPYMSCTSTSTNTTIKWVQQSILHNCWAGCLFCNQDISDH